MNYLYVCHFSNGHIKVGRSIHPQTRIASHEARVSCMGVELVESSIFECVAGSAVPEAALIQRCREHASVNHKSEWFAGLDFEDACQWAREFAAGASRHHEQKSPFAIWLEAEKGRSAALAAHFGKTPAAVSQWKTNGVPLALMKPVREFTGGMVTLEEMVPGLEVGESTPSKQEA